MFGSQMHSITRQAATTLYLSFNRRIGLCASASWCGNSSPSALLQQRDHRSPSSSFWEEQRTNHWLWVFLEACLIGTETLHFGTEHFNRFPLSMKESAFQLSESLGVIWVNEIHEAKASCQKMTQQPGPNFLELSTRPGQETLVAVRVPWQVEKVEEPLEPPSTHLTESTLGSSFQLRFLHQRIPIGEI